MADMMDSENSGSMQSSSSGGGGDDQEYDSRATSASISAFFNNPSSYPNGSGFDHAPLLQLYSLNSLSSSSVLLDQQQPRQQQQQQQQQVCFTSVESQSPNLVVNDDNIHNSSSCGGGGNNGNNLDMVWPNRFGCVRSSSTSSTGDVNCTPHINNHHHNPNNPSNCDSLLLPPLPEVQTTHQDQNQRPQINNPGRNPKKRSRASRRAPTTVLTTDTTNFRQMVQEFTGIPAPPFSGSAFPSGRSSSGSRVDLDLFGGMGIGLGMGMGMSMGMGMGMGLLSRTGNNNTTSMDVSSSSGVAQQQQHHHPRYVLRPFPQKILPHNSLPQQQKPNPISIPTNATTTVAHDASIARDTNTTPPSKETPTAGPEFNLSSQNFVSNANNSILPFQSLLQPSSSSPLMPIIQSSNMESKLTCGSAPMDQFGLGRGILQCGFGSDPGRGHDTISSTTNNPNSTNWDLHQTNCNTTTIGVNEAARNYSDSQRTAAMDATLEDRGGIIRGEGMVDSWICSSD